MSSSRANRHCSIRPGLLYFAPRVRHAARPAPPRTSGRMVNPDGEATLVAPFRFIDRPPWWTLRRNWEEQGGAPGRLRIADQGVSRAVWLAGEPVGQDSGPSDGTREWSDAASSSDQKDRNDLHQGNWLQGNRFSGRSVQGHLVYCHLVWCHGPVGNGQLRRVHFRSPQC